MGVLQGLKGALRGGDEAAKAADDAAPGVRFDDDPFRRRLAADFSGRLAEQPARMVDSGTSNFARAAKYGSGAAVGGVGLHAGSEAYQSHQERQMQESSEATYEEFQQAVQDIQNNDNLSAEEKEERIQTLRDAYEQAAGRAGDAAGGAAVRQVREFFGEMGLVSKLVLAAIVIAAIKAYSGGGR